MARRDPSNGLIQESRWLFNKSTQFENATLAMLLESHETFVHAKSLVDLPHLR